MKRLQFPVLARSASAVLAVGLAAIVAVVVVELGRSPLTTAGSSSVSTNEYLEVEKGNLSTCQPAGLIPQGTTAIRVGVEGRSLSPAVSVKVLASSRVVREGRQVAGAGATPNVTVPIARLSRPLQGARICTTVQPTGEALRFYGKPQGSAGSGRGLRNAVLHMEYMRPGAKSWWSLGSSIIHRMGLGHAPGGGSSFALALLLMLSVVATASWLVWKDLR